MLLAIFLLIDLSYALETTYWDSDLVHKNHNFQNKNPDYTIRNHDFPFKKVKKVKVPHRDFRVSEECLAAFRSGALEKHNELRDMHGVPRLNLDSNLSNIAQAYSKHLASIGELIHSETEIYGENLAMEWSSVSHDQSPGSCYIIGEAVTQDWYNEIHDYCFEHPGFSMNTGHFTQVVWKDSTDVGFGLWFSRDEHSYFAVANYSPPGNFIDEFADNVLPAH